MVRQRLLAAVIGGFVAIVAACCLDGLVTGRSV